MSAPPEPPAAILVVDDEPEMLHNLLTILGAEGYRAIGACDGRSAIDAVRKDPPDLVLCDRMMPGMDGTEVLERIRSEPGLDGTPFIFLTARGEPRDVRTGMNLGADDYLTKPVRIDDLLQAIRVRLTRHRQQAAAPTPPAQGPDTPADLLSLGISPRESEVLHWLLQGKTNGEIATILGLSQGTVKKHFEHIFGKLGVENRAAAIVHALEHLRTRGRGPVTRRT